MFGRNPESGRNPELSALPQNPAEYQGDFISPTEGKTNMGRAIELIRVHDYVDQNRGQ